MESTTAATLLILTLAAVLHLADAQILDFDTLAGDNFACTCLGTDHEQHPFFAVKTCGGNDRDRSDVTLPRARDASNFYGTEDTDTVDDQGRCPLFHACGIPGTHKGTSGVVGGQENPRFDAIRIVRNVPAGFCGPTDLEVNSTRAVLCHRRQPPIAGVRSFRERIQDPTLATADLLARDVLGSSRVCMDHLRHTGSAPFTVCEDETVSATVVDHLVRRGRDRLTPVRFFDLDRFTGFSSLVNQTIRFGMLAVGNASLALAQRKVSYTLTYRTHEDVDLEDETLVTNATDPASRNVSRSVETVVTGTAATLRELRGSITPTQCTDENEKHHHWCLFEIPVDFGSVTNETAQIEASNLQLHLRPHHWDATLNAWNTDPLESPTQATFALAMFDADRTRSSDLDPEPRLEITVRDDPTGWVLDVCASIDAVQPNSAADEQLARVKPLVEISSISGKFSIVEEIDPFGEEPSENRVTFIAPNVPCTRFNMTRLLPFQMWWARDDIIIRARHTVAGPVEQLLSHTSVSERVFADASELFGDSMPRARCYHKSAPVESTINLAIDPDLELVCIVGFPPTVNTTGNTPSATTLATVQLLDCSHRTVHQNQTLTRAPVTSELCIPVVTNIPYERIDHDNASATKWTQALRVRVPTPPTDGIQFRLAFTLPDISPSVQATTADLQAVFPSAEPHPQDRGSLVFSLLPGLVDMDRIEFTRPAAVSYTQCHNRTRQLSVVSPSTLVTDACGSGSFDWMCTSKLELEEEQVVCTFDPSQLAAFHSQNLTCSVPSWHARPNCTATRALTDRTVSLRVHDLTTAMTFVQQAAENHGSNFTKFAEAAQQGTTPSSSRRRVLLQNIDSEMDSITALERYRHMNNLSGVFSITAMGIMLLIVIAGSVWLARSL